MNPLTVYSGLSPRLRVLSAVSVGLAILTLGGAHSIQSLTVVIATLVYHAIVLGYELRAHKVEGGLLREYTNYSAYPSIAIAGILCLGWLLSLVSLIIGMVLYLVSVRLNFFMIIDLVLEVCQLFALGGILQVAVYERRHGAPGAVALDGDA